MRHILQVVIAVCLFAVISNCVNPAGSTTPAIPEVKEIVDLNNCNDSIDYLVIYADQLHDGASYFADYRSTSGYASAITSIENVDSTFPDSSRIASLKTFLKYVDSSWNNPPAFILLLGDNVPDGIPVPDSSISTIGDLIYSDIDSNGLLEFALGRIPARTNAQALTALNKVKAYELNLNRKIGFIVSKFPGDIDVLAPLFLQTFNTLSQQISSGSYIQDSISILDSSYGSGTTSGLLTPGFLQAQKDSLFSFINSQSGYISYLGYGGNNQLGNVNVLSSTDVPRLSTNNIYLLFGCNINDLSKDTLLSRALLFNESGGAVAVLGSTSISYVFQEEDFQIAFFSLLNQNGTKTIGEMVQAVYEQKRNTQKVLFGDPALVLH